MKTFIEIGTCDFDTCAPLVASGSWRGIMCEPVPKYFNSLSEELKDMPYRYNLNMNNVAISSADGKVEMAVSTTANASSWVRGISHITSEQHSGARLSDHPLNAHNYEEEKLKVTAWTLDTLLKHERYIHQIDLLKIDTEGHELDILEAYSWDLLPTMIKCEHHHIDDKKLRILLESKGYVVWTEQYDIYAIR